MFLSNRGRAARGGTYSGFALKEVLAILVVMAMLFAMLWPAISQQRTPSRKTGCINNQHNVGIALIRFEGEKNRYPGSTNNQNPDSEGLGGRETGWVYPLLPYLDRSDIFNTYSAGVSAGQVPDLRLKVLICEVPEGAENARSSYVVNTGWLGDAAPEDRALGVFTQQYRRSADEARTLMNTGSIRDGLATTLMLAENVDAGNWTSPREGCVGFTWQPTAEPSPGFALNEGKGAGECLYPRPSSPHTGGFLATFCDGHTDFIDEDIDYAVYQQLMTPNGASFPQQQPTSESY